MTFCLIVDKFHCLKQLSELFERHSVLKFTHAIEINKKIAFLDVLIDRNDSNYNTSVFVKPTNSGECLSYDSLCTDRYKSGLIKCVLFRAFKICSSWLSFHAEVERIKQLLTNNNFPMKYIDKKLKTSSSSLTNMYFRRIKRQRLKISFHFIFIIKWPLTISRTKTNSSK